MPVSGLNYIAYTTAGLGAPLANEVEGSERVMCFICVNSNTSGYQLCAHTYTQKNVPSRTEVKLNSIAKSYQVTRVPGMNRPWETQIPEVAVDLK